MLREPAQGRGAWLRADGSRMATLDFEGVHAIGPAFADQIFRVFQRDHPEVQLSCANASMDVEKAIRIARVSL
ncbi:MAG TPA: hypothetical protein DEO49_00770 [Sutterella sp.]|nr:hypothetical protein [Sutterella sp.]